MAQGRNRKAGRRTKAGRLSRAGIPAFDHGTEHAQVMVALYGQDGADAIGRAYRLGRLGKGSNAKAMLDTARRISNIYWRAYGMHPITCTLGDRNSGGSGLIDHDKVKRQEQWLNECLKFAQGRGPQADKAFRALVIDINPDSGPRWLDMGCTVTMRAALDVLEPLALDGY